MGKSKTRQEMANEYGIDRKTFYSMLKRISLHLPPGLISPKYQEMIYSHFGKPEKIQENEFHH